VEEGRHRAEYYADFIRRRVVSAGPYTRNGAYAEPVNPFGPRLRNRAPYYCTPKSKNRTPPNRVIWPESKLGLNCVQVVQAVVLESGVTVIEMFSQHRLRRIARPRQVAMWCVERYCPDYSLNDIGYMFGRDHSTVMHAIVSVNERLENGCTKTKALVANVRMRLAAIAEAAQ
jgi:hypothetical protein